MENNDIGRFIQRRAKSGSGGSSTGRHSRVPERLCSLTRTVNAVDLAFVDDGYPISPGLAAIVSQKALLLRIQLKDQRTGEDYPDPAYGQAALIRGKRLPPSPQLPASKRRPRSGHNDGSGPATAVPGPVPILRHSSHFKATPITAFHNVATEYDDDGKVVEFLSTQLVLPAGPQMHIPNFSKAGSWPPQQPCTIRMSSREGEDDQGEGGIAWKYGYDVDTAEELTNVRSNFTKKDHTFLKVDRDDYEYRVGQKVGIAVYRAFSITSEDTGMTSLTDADIVRIYGQNNRVNIYTGHITRVCNSGNCFEHDINTFKGCSGAVVFLLDRGQDGVGVIPDDHGRAIGIHVGGDEVAPGVARNFAFKIL